MTAELDKKKSEMTEAQKEPGEKVQDELKNAWAKFEKLAKWWPDEKKVKTWLEWGGVVEKLSKKLFAFKNEWLSEKCDSLSEDAVRGFDGKKYVALYMAVHDFELGSPGEPYMSHLTGRKNATKEENEKLTENDCKIYVSYINDALQNGYVDKQRVGFWGAAFLQKLCVIAKFALGDYNYFCYYKKDALEKLGSIFGANLGDDENDTNYTTLNNEIVKSAIKLIEGKESLEQMKDSLRLSLALAWLWEQKRDIGVTEQAPNIIFYGAPGTGKTRIVRKYLENEIPDTDDYKERVTWVQFHPSYSYEDFIEGIKPVGMDANGAVKLELVNGHFKDLCIRAKKNLEKEYYFVADEVNRANLSAVFGETLSLLEEGYRDFRKDDSGAEERHYVKTQYSALERELPNELKKKICYEYTEKDGKEAATGAFGVPKNVRFIGMMNDVDKSIDAFDLALRRRFKWVRMKCDYDVIAEEMCGIAPPTYWKSCKELNGFISDKLRLGSSYEFGHSFFLKYAELRQTTRTTDEKARSRLFDEYLAPTLKEYLRGGNSDEKEIDENVMAARNVFLSAQAEPNDEG